MIEYKPAAFCSSRKCLVFFISRAKIYGVPKCSPGEAVGISEGPLCGPDQMRPDAQRISVS